MTEQLNRIQEKLDLLRHGYIWSDDRGNDAGIYPSLELGNEKKLSFLDWYEYWLDSSLSELA
ncbi:hypothetical protein SAMN05660909_02938 [Chitinophaga terrae (ex Kim and Jung 2007)]|uniref:Uncharacterized protein n=1 Tax=Chitinophaga terrae (ex Kim and Jung 2007) TaxID=408074 RepID=A0A1H4D411_9BACT|nr:hypothetical protein [Chitinophaga terrae (ex Kim and Jung 2007)]GEP90576.1 hypothetical protein CTE07_22210 [Chitinophaga terrae (ex Kim and Jung 2007)]SEA67240.1 hypothetical protein SAMN05660909_02938 [Chitinophaga terrae (ex Kim and Jung 2007)]